MNIFEMAKIPLERASTIMELDANVSKLLSQPERTLEVSIPVQMDDGRLEVFTGYRAQLTTALGPAKGGVRYHPAVSMDEVKTLAFWMAIKCAVLGLPYGGGKGGIIVDPQKLSRGELERLTRGYIQRIAPLIGERVDIPAPDVNTDSRIMGWMVDEFSKIKGETVYGVVTGKPKILGGSAGRGSATGRGVMLCAREAFKKLRIKPLDATVAVQGFGNVGSFSAKLIHDMKAKIVAISDVTGGIYNEAGMNPYDVEKYAKGNNNSVIGFPGSKTINNQELLALPVTLLVPAALENQINAENVHTIQARIIVEAANGPTTPDADAELVRRGVMIIPDVLANAGGVTVSYFEWVQNLYRYYWSEKEVHAKLEEMMVEAFNNVYDTANLHRTDLRIGAYITALGRISEACKMRGWA